MSSGELQVNTPNKAIKVETKTALTFEVASALRDKVLKGTAIFKTGIPIELEIVTETENGYEEKTVVIPYNTVMSWVKRDKIIPNTNKTLREFLDEAREKRANALTKWQKEYLRRLAMKQVEKVLNMSIDIKRKEIKAIYGKDKNGRDVELRKSVKIFSGTDHKKMYFQNEMTKYVLEHLDPSFMKQPEKVAVTPEFSFLALADRREEMIKEGKLHSI